MRNDLPISPKKKFKYSITFQSFDEESLEAGDSFDRGYEVEDDTELIGEILYKANTTYGIYMPVSFGNWESTEPNEDRDFWEKGIRKYYALHLTNEDGTEISQEESDFISFLLSDGHYEINKFRDYAVGGIVLGSIALGVGALITYFYFKGKKGGKGKKGSINNRAKSVTHIINGKKRKFPIKDAWRKDHNVENKSQKFEVPQADRYEMGGDASQHYHEIEYGEGGVARAKDIITKKIGFNEIIADYLIGKSEKFAIWLADSILKQEIAEREENKSVVLESLNQRSYSVNTNYINNNYGGGIREVLDWLQHPVTPKQDLKQLSFDQALEKAREWHNELQVLGGDIDFTEPDTNTIIKTYPKNSDGIEYYWVFIPSNYCNLESSRMGHCGRTGYGNKLISLRSVKEYGKGHTISDSHITIAYSQSDNNDTENDGIFYQVKGKKNNKPAEKYFPYIFDLIKSILNGEINERFRKENDESIKVFEYLLNERKKIEDEILPLITFPSLGGASSTESRFLKGELSLDESRKYLSQDSPIYDNFRTIYKLNEKLNEVRNNRDYEEIQNEQVRLREEEKTYFKENIFDKYKELGRLGSLQKEAENELIYFYFNGFGSEYGAEEDYGFDDMTKEELRELYQLKPTIFNDAESILAIYDAGVITAEELKTLKDGNQEFDTFGNQMKLYERGIILEKPSTTFKLNFDCDDVSRLLSVDRDIRDTLIEDVLCGDAFDYLGGFDYYYDNPTDLVNNLNKENSQKVIDEIVRITGLDKSVVEENGIEHYLGNQDEDFPSDDFDTIIRALASAQNVADERDYVNYLYKAIESALEELGVIESLDSEGVKMNIDLSNLMSEEDIISQMDNYELTYISDLFSEELASGNIDLPSFSIDDRYSPYGSSEDFNDYFSDSDLESFAKGGSLRPKSTTSKKTKIKNMKPSQRKLAQGGSIGTTGISKEDYLLVVQNWVYFTFNYPMGFVKDAFGSKHLEEKFSSSYERFGSRGVCMSFWANLDGNNRIILALWIKNNYFNSASEKTKLQSISDDNYAEIITHWNMFCFNFPYGFIENVYGDNTSHFEMKWVRAYESAGSTGAVNKFFTEMSSNNQMLLTDWVYDNYKGMSFADGGLVEKKGKIELSDGAEGRKIAKRIIVEKDDVGDLVTYDLEVGLFEGRKKGYFIVEGTWDEVMEAGTEDEYTEEQYYYQEGSLSIEGGKVYDYDGVFELEPKLKPLMSALNLNSSEVFADGGDVTKKPTQSQLDNMTAFNLMDAMKNDKKNYELYKKQLLKLYPDAKGFADGGKAQIKNEKTMKYANGGEAGKKFAKGGMFGGSAKLEYIGDAYASDEMADKLRKKLKIKGDSLANKDVISFAYTDYGGDFLDKVAIAYFSENYPENIIKENSGYGGENAFVFGEPAKEWMETTENYPLGFENIEDFYYEKVSEQENKDFNYFLDEISAEYSFHRPAVIYWLEENKGGYGNITTQGLDFSYEDLIQELVIENLIEKIKDDEDEYANGGETSETTRDNYDALIGRVDNEFYFLDDIFKYKDGFKGATGTIVMPVNSQYYEYATSEDGILERFMDAMGEDEWLEALQLNRDDFEDEDDLTKAIEDGIYQLYSYGELHPFEYAGSDIESQMRELSEFADESKYPLFEVIGGGRIFGKDVVFDEIYNQELYDKIKQIEEFAKGGEAGKKYILLGYSATASKDSYEEGELESVGDWDATLSKEFSNKKDLIDYINNNIIYVDYEESNFDWETGDGKNIQTDVLCTYDDYNGYFPADEKAKQLWKKGKKELFNVHYFIDVQAVIPTTYKKGGSVKGIKKKAEQLLEESITYVWTSNDMGSGWKFMLENPNGGVLDTSLVLDIFDGDEYVSEYDDVEDWNSLSKADKKYYFDQYKEELLQVNYDYFKDEMVLNYLDEFIEYLQRDSDDNFAEGGSTDDDDDSGEIQEQLNELVQDFSSDEYKAFCYEHDIELSDAEEMVNFIYSQTNNRCKEIIQEIEDGYYAGGDDNDYDDYAEGGLVVKNNTDLEEVAKYMTNAVKKHRWDLKDLIHYFEKDNNFDYKKRVKIWEDMNGYEMKKTYDNIYEMLKRISEANGSKFAEGGELELKTWREDGVSENEKMDYNKLTRSEVKDILKELGYNVTKDNFSKFHKKEHFDYIKEKDVFYRNDVNDEYAEGGGLGNIGKPYSFDVIATKKSGEKIKELRVAYAETKQIAKENLLEFLKNKLHYTKIKIIAGREGHEKRSRMADGGEAREFNYLYVTEVPNGLKLELTDEGINGYNEEEINDMYDLFEDIQANSEMAYIDNAGDMGFGLTEAPIVTDGYFYDDNGDFTDEGHLDSKVYVWNDYMLKDLFATLMEQGSVVLMEVKSNGGSTYKKGGEISIWNLRKGDKIKTRKGDIETIERKIESGYFTKENEYSHSFESIEFIERPNRTMADGGSLNDYIDEQVDEFDDDENKMREQYRGYVRDIEYQGFLAIDLSLTPNERLSDYEFDGEEFDRDNLLEVAKKYPQAEYITFHARLMGDSDFGIEDELSPIDDLAMEFDMAKLNQYAEGGEAGKKRYDEVIDKKILDRAKELFEKIQENTRMLYAMDSRSNLPYPNTNKTKTEIEKENIKLDKELEKLDLQIIDAYSNDDRIDKRLSLTPYSFTRHKNRLYSRIPQSIENKIIKIYKKYKFFLSEKDGKKALKSKNQRGYGAGTIGTFVFGIKDSNDAELVGGTALELGEYYDKVKKENKEFFSYYRKNYSDGGEAGDDLENYSDYDEFYNFVFDYIKREENLTEEETKDICNVNESIIEAEFEGGSSPRFTGDVVLGYLSNERAYKNYAKGGKIGLTKSEISIIDDRIEYYFDNEEYTDDSESLASFVIDGGKIDYSKYKQILEYIESQGYAGDDENDDDDYAEGGSTDDDDDSGEIQEQLNELVQDFSSDEYKAFCYEHDIELSDAEEMVNFIYSQTNNRCKEIIQEIEDGYYTGGHYEEDDDEDDYAKGGTIYSHSEEDGATFNITEVRIGGVVSYKFDSLSEAENQYDRLIDYVKEEIENERNTTTEVIVLEGYVEGHGMGWETIKAFDVDEYLESFNEDNFAEGGEVEDWMEEALASLIEETGNDNLEITYVVDSKIKYEFIASDGDVEYRVFISEEDAENIAVEQVTEDLQENPDYFNQDWLMNYIDGRDFFEEQLTEMNDSYVQDIESETYKTKYANRLIDELVENGLMDEEDAESDNAEELADDLKYDYVALLTQEKLEEGNDGLDYFINNFGEKETFKMVLDNNLIDIEEASKDAVQEDGIGHFLSSYDGETLYLSDDCVAYRVN